MTGATGKEERERARRCFGVWQCHVYFCTALFGISVLVYILFVWAQGTPAVSVLDATHYADTTRNSAW